jgi:hypothetical protein
MIIKMHPKLPHLSLFMNRECMVHESGCKEIIYLQMKTSPARWVYIHTRELSLQALNFTLRKLFIYNEINALNFT